MSTTAESDEQDDMEDGWQVKVVPRSTSNKRPDLKRSPSQRDLSPTASSTSSDHTTVEDIGLGFDEDDSDSELDEDAEGEFENELEDIMLGRPSVSLDSDFKLFKSSVSSYSKIATTDQESDSSDDDDEEVKQDEGIVQKMLIPVPPFLQEDDDQARLELEEFENMEFLRGLIVPFDYGQTNKPHTSVVEQIERNTAGPVDEEVADRQNAKAMSDGVEALKLGNAAKQGPDTVTPGATQTLSYAPEKQEQGVPSVYRTAGLSAAVSAFQASKSNSHPNVTRRYGSNQRSYGNAGSTYGSLKFTSRPSGNDENSLLSTNDFLKDIYGRSRQRSPSPPPVEYDKPVPLRSPPRKRQKIC
jgi:hypothetical protein